VLGIYHCPIKPAQSWIFSPFRYSINKESIAQELEKISELGVGWVRTPLRWTYIERRRGEIDFAFEKNFFDWYFRQIRRRGMKILAILGDDIPRWAPRHPIKEFGNFAAAAMSHYGRYFSLVQVANEIDSPPVSNKQPFRWNRPAAAAYIKAGIGAVRSAHPNLPVVVNSFSPRSLEWYDYLILRGADFDFVGLDFYPGSWSFGWAGRWRKILAKVSNKLPRPAIITEAGQSSWARWMGLGESAQARFIKHFFAQPLKGVQGVFWFCLKDYRFLSEFVPMEEHFGVLRKDGSEKAGYKVLKEQAESSRLARALAS